MKCPNCDFIMPDDSLFCSKCASDLQKSSLLSIEDYECVSEDAEMPEPDATEKYKPGNVVKITTSKLDGVDVLGKLKSVGQFLLKNVRVTPNDLGLFILVFACGGGPLVWLSMFVWIAFFAVGTLLIMLPRSVFVIEGRNTYHFNHKCGGIENAKMKFMSTTRKKGMNPCAVCALPSFSSRMKGLRKYIITVALGFLTAFLFLSISGSLGSMKYITLEDIPVMYALVTIIYAFISLDLSVFMSKIPVKNTI